MAKLDVTKVKVTKTLRHNRQLTSCRFSPCGKYVAAVGLDSGVHRWSLESDEPMKVEWKAHRGWVADLVFQPHGKRLFSADYHGTIVCWNYEAANGQPVWRVDNAHAGWIRAVACSPDGTRLASVGTDGLVRMWSTSDGKRTAELAGHDADLFSIAFHPDGKSVLSGDIMGRVIQWDIATGKKFREFDAKALHTRLDDFLADVGGVRCLAISDDGKTLACGGMTDAKSNGFCPGTPGVIVFDWATGKRTTTLVVEHTADGPIKGLCFLEDGTLAGYGEGASGASLAFWRTDQPKPIHSIKTLSGYGVDRHPDGTSLAVVLYQGNGRTGNGRHSKREEYVSNNGIVQIYAASAT